MLERIVQQTWAYWFGRALFRFYAKLFLGLRIEGSDNVPRTGRLVLAANHFSALDPPVVGTCVPREIHFMAKRELFEKGSSTRLFMLMFRVFPVNRTGSDIGAVRTALKRLKDEMAIGIFIQGTRSADGSALALNGAAYMAQRAEAPLLPAAVWREGRRYTVSFGKPLSAAGFEGRTDELTDLLSERINALLPEGRHIGRRAA